MSLLQVQGLARAFGGVRAVRDVSFTLARGEMLALIGPNGAGKSTTFNLLNGQLQADAGSATLNGRPMLGRSARQIARLGVGRTFQIAETFGSLTVLENVQMALLAHDRGIWNLLRRAANYRLAHAQALLAQVGMAEHAQRPCSTLAYGDVKRVELALALANDPCLLLMDEPTAGMAPQERHSLMALTRTLARERNMGVLFTEHSMDVVFANADRIVVMARGRVLADGTPAAVQADPKVREAYFGSGRLAGLAEVAT